MKKLGKKWLAVFAVCTLSVILCGFTQTAYAQSEEFDSSWQYSSSFSSVFTYLNYNIGDRVLFGNGLVYEVVELTAESGKKCQAYKALTEFDKSLIESLDNEYDAKYPSANRLYSATGRFNCHSYAWYNQNCDTNDIWVDEPDTLISGNYYNETSTPIAGDRICYYNSDGFNLHSGIVEEVLGGVSNGVCGDANTVSVVSKWGSAGVYRHRGDECPYPDGTGVYRAVSVKYFHKHSYTHSYKWENLQKHYAYCACGDFKLTGHIIKKSDITPFLRPIYYTCMRCGGSAEYGFVVNSVSFATFTENGSYVLPNGVIVLAQGDFDAYFAGTLTLLGGRDTDVMSAA